MENSYQWIEDLEKYLNSDEDILEPEEVIETPKGLEGNITPDEVRCCGQDLLYLVKELLLKSTVHTEININDENLYLVHAKADKNTDKKKETVEEYLIEGREDDLYNCVWARVDNDKNNNISEKWKEEDIGKEKMFTIIGHTPTDDNKIAIHNSYAIIDCGASYYGNGCLLRLNDGKTVYYDNVTRCLEQVKSEEER
ncbi:unknown [Clostridium sp. CAG:452]|nr:unknown [Clostridium sp. CAG:452]